MYHDFDQLALFCLLLLPTTTCVSYYVVGNGHKAVACDMVLPNGKRVHLASGLE